MASSITHVLLIMVLVMCSVSTDQSPDEVGKIRDQLQQLNNRMTEQEHRLMDQEQKLMNQEQKLMGQEQKLMDQEQKYIDQEQEISELKKSHAKDLSMSGVHGFSVHLTASPYSTAGTIVFPVVDFIQGSGYNQTTGIYTAPVDGFYLFHGELVGYTSSTYVYLTLNGARKQEFYLYTNYDYNAATLGGIFKLSVGETVNLELENGDSLSCDYDTCHFDGYLLYAII